MSKFLLLNYFTSFLLTTIILKKKRKSTVVTGVLTVNQSNTVLPSDWSLSTKTTPPTCSQRNLETMTTSHHVSSHWHDYYIHGHVDSTNGGYNHINQKTVLPSDWSLSTKSRPPTTCTQ